MIKLLGFTPDLDPTIPGTLVDVSNMVPTVKGMAAAPSPASAGLSTLVGTCTGAAILSKLDGSFRVFAGTSTAIYEASGSTWTSVASTTYSNGVDATWSFAQFGNVSLAVTKDTTLQASTSGAFVGVTSAPSASIVETVGSFVFLCDTTEGVYGDSPNRWWCCAQGDFTDWTPAIATGSVTGLLTSSPGAIRAARRLGEYLIIYKSRAIFLGQFVGAPIWWDFREISSEAGAVGKRAVLPVVMENGGYMHFVMGADNFYSFDGSRPIAIGAPIKEYVFTRLNKQYSYRAEALHDKEKSVIYWFYPTTGSSLTAGVAYNYKTGQWGRVDLPIETALEFSETGVTYDDLGSLYSTYDDFPEASYDVAFGAPYAVQPSIFAGQVLKTLTGTPGASSFTTGDMGSELGYSTVTRVQCRYLQAPSSASLRHYYRPQLSDPLVSGANPTQSNGRFDLLSSSRWHRFGVEMNGNAEVTGLEITMVPDGED